MFFILSKVLGFLVSPFLIALLLLGLSLFLKRKRKVLQISALMVVLFFSNPFLFRQTVNWWEGDLKPLAVTGKETAVVVLGGYCSYNDATKRIRFSQSSDRLMQALTVHVKYKKPLVLSGGSANIILKEKPEALVVNEYLLTLGFDGNAIWVDSLSRNTHENSVRTAALFEAAGQDKNIVLVTSAWHMHRAVKCFEKQGFRVTPYGADSLSGIEQPGLNDYFIPSPSVLASWELLFREWIGIGVYFLKGYV